MSVRLRASLAVLCVVLFSARVGECAAAVNQQSTAEVLSGVKGWGDVSCCVDELVSQGLSIIPDVLQLINKNSLAGTPGVEEPAGPLSPCQRTTLSSVLAEHPWSNLRGTLRTYAGAGLDNRERVVLLGVFERLGDREDLEFALELAIADEELTILPPELVDACEGALIGLLANDEGGIANLSKLFRQTHLCLLLPVIHAMGSQHSSQSLDALVALLGYNADADALILTEAARLAAVLPVVERKGARGALRNYVDHWDVRLSLLAVAAVEKVGDHDSVSKLIRLLDSSEPSLRSAATQALRSLTRQTHLSNQAAWISWQRAELIWWKKQAHACGRDIVSGTRAASVAAIEEIAKHRLYPERLAELLLPGLERTEPHVLRLACKALAVCESPLAVPALIDSLEQTDPNVLDAAHRALIRITGIDVGLNPKTWRETLENRRRKR